MPRKQATKPRGRSNDVKWQQVLDAAKEAFLAKGYQAARIEDVADRLGMLKGSIYYYIRTKEDLLYELVLRVNAASEQLLDEIPTEGDAAARLGVFVERWMKHVAEWQDYSLLFDREARFLSATRLRRVQRQRHDIDRFLRSIIEDGVRERTFSPRADPAVVTRAIFLVLNGTTTWYRDEGPLSFAEIGERYAEFFLDGLRAHP